MGTFLVYQAMLADRPVAVLSIRVRPSKAPRAPGFTPLRVRVRYAAADGAVLTHSGLLYAQTTWAYEVEGWQLLGHALYVSLVPARRAKPALGELPDPSRWGPQQRVLQIPIRVPVWGAADIKGARHRLFVRAMAWDGQLSLVGRLRLDLGRIPIRVPFCCHMPGALDWDLSCRAYGSLIGLRLALRRGWIEGSATLWLWAAPAPSAHWHPYGPPVRLRQVSGQVGWAGAVPAGCDSAMVRGEVEADLFWIDGHGISRCATRRAPWSAMADLPGYDPNCDRLEVSAQVTASRAAVAGCSTVADLQVQAAVVALRPSFLPGLGGYVRTEQVIAYWSGQVEVRLPLLSHPPVSTKWLEPVPQVERAWQQLALGDTAAQVKVAQVLHVPVPGPVAAITRCSPRGFVLVCGGTGAHFCEASLPEAFAAWPVEQAGVWSLHVMPLLDG